MQEKKNCSESYVKIKLDSTFAILSDERQWILGELNKHYDPKNSKTSEYIHRGFYSNINNLIASYIDLCARRSGSKTIKELQDFIKVRSKALQGITPLSIMVGGILQ